MARTFEHYHLSMVERDQPDLYVATTTREQWLRRIFGEPFTFTHMGKEFHWVPRTEGAPNILGIVERQKPRRQHRSPEDGADEFEAMEWQGSLVVIDPEYRPDGQKLAFEVDANVGKTNALLDSMVAHINNGTNQYTIVVRALFDSEGFWSFARRHGGVVEYVSFKFVVPNMFFGASTSIDQGLRRIGEDTNAQEVEVKIDSDDGVKTDSDTIKDGMAYAEAGNASVTAKALNGDRYTSSKRRKTSKVIDIIIEGRESLALLMKKALGRDEDDSVDADDRPSSDPNLG
jgi:hypothetical protein